MPPRRGPWSPGEDNRLLSLIDDHGPTNWVRISHILATRTPKQCRERYHQNLKPTLNHSPITDQEGLYIEQLVAQYGKKWAEIARHLNGRSDNAVKNWWNGGANRRRRASIVTSSPGGPGGPAAAAPADTAHSNGTYHHQQPQQQQQPPQSQQPSTYPVNEASQHLPPHGHQHSSSSSQLLQQSAASGSLQGPPHLSPHPGPPTQPSLFNPAFSMGGQQVSSQRAHPPPATLPPMHAGPPFPSVAQSSPAHPPPNPAPSGPFDSMPSHTNDQQQPPYPAFRHRVSLPNIHAASNQYNNSPLASRGPPATLPVVFNSAYTSDSSGFRKSSTVQTSSNVDPHQKQLQDAGSIDQSYPASTSPYPLPPIQGSDPRFPRRNSRSSSVFIHSPLRKRAVGAAADELFANTPYTRRFSTSTILPGGYKSRNSSIDGGVSSASDNEDPLSAASHSLSKYSLASASNSRKNSHVVPQPDLHSQQHTPLLPPMAESSNSPPPPTLLTLPAATALASVSGVQENIPPSRQFTPPSYPKTNSAFNSGMGGFNNPFAKRHSVGGYTPNSGLSASKNMPMPLSRIDSRAPDDGPHSGGPISGDRYSRPPSEVLESWGRSNSTSSARRSSSVSSHDHVLPVSKGGDVEMTMNASDTHAQVIKDTQPPAVPMVVAQNQLSISNLLS